MKKVLFIIGLLGSLYSGASAWDFEYKTSNTIYRPEFQECTCLPRPGTIQDILDGVKNGQIKYVQGKVITFKNGNVGYYNQLAVKTANGVGNMHTFSDYDTCVAVIDMLGLPLRRR